MRTDASESLGADDPYLLRRFVEAQQNDYEEALFEIKSGRKRSHWMWYVFPQFEGLGFSSTCKWFAIKSLEEAQAYLAHPVLGPRLMECVAALLAIDGRTAHEIFGSPDELKLRSCATLFACVSPAGSPFEKVLGKYFQGKSDEKTLQMLEKMRK